MLLSDLTTIFARLESQGAFEGEPFEVLARTDATGKIVAIFVGLSGDLGEWVTLRLDS